MTNEISTKPRPLGRKAYGSTPHLPGSRVGPTESTVEQGQYEMCCVKTRGRQDRVIVSEKLDGSGVAVAKRDGRILALTRAGYLAHTSPFPQHHYFAWWVEGRKRAFHSLLAEGEVANGEWLMMAHGTKYKLTHDPFVVFSMAKPNKVRLPWDEMVRGAEFNGFVTPRVISDGPALSIDAAKELLAANPGHHGAEEEIEGAVWRVETHGEFSFLAKWVNPNKEDGKYLAGINGSEDMPLYLPAS